MNKEKQIEELTNDICYACHGRKVCTGENCAMANIVAKELYEKGYRKIDKSTLCSVDEIAEEICKDCQNKMDSVFDCNCQKKPCDKAIKQAKAICSNGYVLVQKVAWDYLTGKIKPKFEKPKGTKRLNLFSEVKKQTAKEIWQFIFSLFPSDKNFTIISKSTIKAKLKEYDVEIENASKE